MAQAIQQKNFRLPDDLAIQLKQASAEAGKTETEIVVEALTAYLNPEIPTLKGVYDRLDKILETPATTKKEVKGKQSRIPAVIQ